MCYLKRLYAGFPRYCKINGFFYLFTNNNAFVFLFFMLLPIVQYQLLTADFAYDFQRNKPNYPLESDVKNGS